MQHFVAVKTLCVMGMMTGGVVITREMTDDKSEEDSEMIRSHFLQIERNNTSRAKDGNVVSQKEER